MLETELKKLWQEIDAPLKWNIEKISNSYSLEKDIHKLSKTLFWRNMRETVVFVIVSFFFMKYYFDPNLPYLSKMGCILSVIGGVYIIGKLWIIRKKLTTDTNLHIVEYLKKSKEYFEAEKNNNNNILYHSIFPFLPGYLLFMVGMIPNRTLTHKIAGFAFGLLVIIGVWWLNKQAAKKAYEPILNKLNEQIKVWEA